MLKKFSCFLLTALFLVSCGSSAKTNPDETISLNEAIARASADIMKKVPPNSKIAFFNISESDYSVVTEYVIEEISAVLVDKAKLIVVDRSNMDVIDAEHEFQMSGRVSDDEILSIAKKFGATSVVSCSVSGQFDLRRLRVRALEVETGKVMSLTSHSVKNLSDYAKPQTVIPRENTTPAVAVVPAIPEITYQIGERGPGGGIIFYDKGSFNDGWRYMEAAPADTEVKNLRWGAYGHDVSGTLVDLGSGKRNTQIILNYIRSLNQSGMAAQMCSQLNSGGKTDWFLPSREELHWMYLNLHSKGFGGFKNVRYWSSSQVDKNRAWYLHFGENGRASDNYDKNRYSFLSGEIWTRAIRAF
jgi:hypothetical protein